MIWNHSSAGTDAVRWKVTVLLALSTDTALFTLAKVRSAGLRLGKRYWD